MLSAVNAEMLNKIMDPVAQKTQIGTEIRNSLLNGLVVVPVDVTDGSTGQSFTIPESMVLFYVIALSKATVTSATAQVRKSTTAITNAMDIDTVDTLASAATIDVTYQVLTAGDTLNILTASANDKALVCLIGYRI